MGEVPLMKDSRLFKKKLVTNQGYSHQESYINCPHCGHEDSWNDGLSGSSEQWDLLDCDQCELQFECQLQTVFSTRKVMKIEKVINDL